MIQPYHTTLSYMPRPYDTTIQTIIHATTPSMPRTEPIRTDRGHIPTHPLLCGLDVLDACGRPHAKLRAATEDEKQHRAKHLAEEHWGTLQPQC
jgi:hypothetical protein